MEFVVCKTIELEKVGFDTAKLRKSIDKNKALIHLTFVKQLITDVESNDDFTIYTAPSTELTTLLASSVWNSEEEQI